MSRGIGKLQREAMAVLWDRAKSEGIAAGVPLADLKRSLGADRSNARRAIRGLIERELTEEIAGEEGERRVKLTGGGHLALWLASYADEMLALERVPSRPLVLDAFAGEDLGIVEEDTLGLDTLMELGYPHGASPQTPDLPVSDNGPGRAEHGDAIQDRLSHANAAASSDRSISDNDERGGSTVMELVAKIAQEWLERLDEEAGEEEA